MNSQKIIGALLIALGLCGLAYCWVIVLDTHAHQQALTGIIMVAIFCFFGGLASLRHAMEDQKIKD